MKQLKCSKCEKYKPNSEFALKATSPRGYNYNCKNCHNSYCREIWYKKNREGQIARVRKYKISNKAEILAQKYNIPVEIINSKLPTDSICPICKEESSLVLDHCHKSNKLRGFICKKCNFLLGQSNDNTQILQSAIEYLIVAQR